MRKKLVFLVIFFMICSFGFSTYKGKGKMRGVVVDEQGNPLQDVKVKLFCLRAQDGFTTTTDSDGEWKAFYIRGGIWHVDFSKPGYTPEKISTDVKEFGKLVEIETTLKKMEGLVLTDSLIDELNKANELFNEKKYDDAQKIYEKLLTENPDAYILNVNIGNCYFQKENYQKAIEYYKKVLEENPDYTRALISAGNAYINMKDKENALKYYEKVDIEKIKDTVVLYNIGNILYSHAQYEKAIEYFEKITKINPEDAEAFYQLGMSYTSLNKQQEAIKALEKFIELAPDSKNADVAKTIIEAYKKEENKQ